MTSLDLLKLVESQARKYKKAGIKDSLIRNNHMNDLQEFSAEKAEMDDALIDAVLVDFVNFIGMSQGIDYGLYTSDLQKEESE